MSADELREWLLALSRELRDMDKDWLPPILEQLQELEMVTLRTLHVLDKVRR